MEYIKYIFNKRFGKMRFIFNPMTLFIGMWCLLMLIILLVSGQI